MPVAPGLDGCVPNAPPVAGGCVEPNKPVVAEGAGAPKKPPVFGGYVELGAPNIPVPPGAPAAPT